MKNYLHEAKNEARGTTFLNKLVAVIVAQIVLVTSIIRKRPV